MGDVIPFPVPSRRKATKPARRLGRKPARPCKLEPDAAPGFTIDFDAGEGGDYVRIIVTVPRGRGPDVIKAVQPMLTAPVAAS